MKPKEKLYYMLNSYINGEYDAKTFCEIFSDTYHQDLDVEDLNIKEKKLFKELSLLIERFSPYEDDLQKFEYYIGEEKIKEKVETIFCELGHYE
jgi:hypothetical protein